MHIHGVANVLINLWMAHKLCACITTTSYRFSAGLVRPCIYIVLCFFSLDFFLLIYTNVIRVRVNFNCAWFSGWDQARYFPSISIDSTTKQRNSFCKISSSLSLTRSSCVYWFERICASVCSCIVTIPPIWTRATLIATFNFVESSCIFICAIRNATFPWTRYASERKTTAAAATASVQKKEQQQ